MQRNDFDPAGNAFPPTRWLTVRSAGDPEAPESRRSMEELARTYWRPVYAYLRLRWSCSPEEAQDLTQDFFLSLCRKEFLQKVRPDRGRFRAYLRASLDNHFKMYRRATRRKKRGGDRVITSLDAVPGLAPASSESPDRAFDQEWARSIAMGVLREMERDCPQDDFRLFYRMDVLRPAGEHPSRRTEGEVFRTLRRMRSEFRRRMVAKARETELSAALRGEEA